ncbi:MAG: hypothetical protein LBE35_06840 [Clostridiales bacterium]|jgi:hypothetical protein|nr:hypothetical protein [Clostridiales bacterium]
MTALSAKHDLLYMIDFIDEDKARELLYYARNWLMEDFEPRKDFENCEILSKAKYALEEMRKNATPESVRDMTLEEINAHIKEVRAERRAEREFHEASA